MFRQGKARALIHNLRLAAMLSFVAGIVNITGVFSIQTLTTNVTGHFAFFSEEFALGNYGLAFAFLAYIIAFLAGAFTSGFLIELVYRRKPDVSHASPMLLEVILLVLVVLLGNNDLIGNGQIALFLLFAMGLQNALVTKVSKATVRTTHLTGLFTDLGIELSQLFFYRQKKESQKLSKSIRLRLVIIIFFFLGCVIGGFIYQYYALRTLFIASASLLIALFYDNLRFMFHLFTRRLHAKFKS